MSEPRMSALLGKSKDILFTSKTQRRDRRRQSGSCACRVELPGGWRSFVMKSGIGTSEEIYKS